MLTVQCDSLLNSQKIIQIWLVKSTSRAQPLTFIRAWFFCVSQQAKITNWKRQYPYSSLVGSRKQTGPALLQESQIFIFFTTVSSPKRGEIIQSCKTWGALKAAFWTYQKIYIRIATHHGSLSLKKGQSNTLMQDIHLFLLLT